MKKAEVVPLCHSASLPHRQTERQADRQTERRTERQRDSQTQKQPERQPARETARDRLCRETERQPDRNSQRQTLQRDRDSLPDIGTATAETLDSQRQTAYSAYWEEVCVWPFHLTALESVLDQMIAA